MLAPPLQLLQLLASLIWLWLNCADAIIPTRMEYVHLEQEISKIYGSSAKVPPTTYVLVTLTIAITRLESTAVGEIIAYGDIQLKWQDETIAWDPRSFQNITYTLLHSTSIWYPKPSFRNTRHTISNQLIEVDYKGKCECRVHFSITLKQATFQRTILQLQIGDDESSVMLSPAEISITGATVVERSIFQIAYIDQWQDKRLSNVLNIVFDVSKQCKIDAKEIVLIISRFVAQISTFLIKPQNIHRITIALLSTLLSLFNTLLADCIRSSDQLVSMIILIVIVGETFTLLLVHRIWELILLKRHKRNSRLYHLSDYFTQRTSTIASTSWQQQYQQQQHYQLLPLSSSRPRSMLLSQDLQRIVSMPQQNFGTNYTNFGQAQGQGVGQGQGQAQAQGHDQDHAFQAQLNKIWTKLILADRVCAIVVALLYILLEIIFAWCNI